MVELLTRTQNGQGFDIQLITFENRHEILARVEPFHAQLKLVASRKWVELLKNVDVGAEAVFGVLDGEDMGLVLQRHKIINIGGLELTVTMRLIRVVSPAYQQKDLAAEFTKETLNRIHPVAFTGRTPNPYIILSDERSGVIQEIPSVSGVSRSPRLFSPEEKILLTATLDQRSLSETDLRTGLCRGVYPPGESRLFILNPDNPDAVRIHKRFTEPEPGGLGANLEGGDGIRYLSIADPKKMDLLRKGIAA